MFCPHCGTAVNLTVPAPCGRCGFDLVTYQINLAAAGVVVDPVITPTLAESDTAPTEAPARAETTPLPEKVSVSPSPTNGKIVLIIEDDQLIAEMYKQRLVAAGYTVDVASDGTEGYKKLEIGQYRLLLLDIMLPGLNGLNILRAMKSDHKLPDIPVIVLSNLDQGSVIDRSIELGAVHFLVKANYTPGEILKLVDKILA